jgi:hypothetical protein
MSATKTLTLFLISSALIVHRLVGIHLLSRIKILCGSLFNVADGIFIGCGVGIIALFWARYAFVGGTCFHRSCMFSFI